ncbi:MAG: tRNA 2-thiouridine(34) synthase MnmA [Bacteroidales bacterium]|nr:tRNA 2-thiouridine(34) synthase MnmA [Bacteroidales bacterium]
MKIAALVSGGVDSSVTIPLLKKQGYDPHIFYIRIGMEDEPSFMDCPAEEDIEITTWIAKKYGCKMEVVDLQEEYWATVVKYTIDSVKSGFTPNPDIMCNLLIKFGAFNERYGHEFDRITTGHYATQYETNEGMFLSTAADRVKDQTYFLGQITPEQLTKAMFPIGHLQKKEVRALAEEMKLPSAHRPDSQGICFLGKINYSDFIRKYVGEKPGEIIELETGKVLGEHKGFWFHTIGQRRGLRLGGGPWFVVKKDIEKNIVYVSNGYDPIAQYDDKIWLENLHFLNTKHNYDELSAVKYKIRHQPEFNSGTLIRDEKGIRIVSDNKISGIAPGQYAVVYDTEEKTCIGSGMIAQNPD